MIDPFAVWLMIGDKSCGCNLRPISMFIMIEELSLSLTIHIILCFREINIWGWPHPGE